MLRRGLLWCRQVLGSTHTTPIGSRRLSKTDFSPWPSALRPHERGVELAYDGADLQRAMSFIPRLDTEKALADVSAAMEFAATATGKKVGVVGYCFGGTLAWLAATRLHPAAAVGYYGGRIGNYAGETPSAPVMLHFGKQDQLTYPAEEVERVHAAHPDGGDLLVRRRPRLQLRCSREL